MEMTPGWLPDTADLSLLQREETDGFTVPGLEAIAAEWCGHTFLSSRG